MTAVARPYGASRSPSRAPIRQLDVGLAVTVIVISVFGAAMIYSSSHRRLEAAGISGTYFMRRQAMFIALGIVVMLACTLFDYRIIRDRAIIVYSGVAAMLLGVLSPLGSRSRGIQAWYSVGSFQLQPSEFAKLAVIVALAAYCHEHRGQLDAWRLLIAGAVALVPLGLIYLQPDLGTFMILVIVSMCLLLVAGARPRHLAIVALLGMISFGVMARTGVFEKYQLDRLTGFAQQSRSDLSNPTAYNLEQSKIAIATGGLTGKGFGEGTQTSLSFVPEQHTDFVFTVVGEEFGFLGGMTLLLLFALVVWRSWRTARLARELFGVLLATGVMAMIAFQVFQNIGMTMGIMPITGIPLPFVSYGGSSTVMSFAAIGLVLNVGARRFT